MKVKRERKYEAQVDGETKAWRKVHFIKNQDRLPKLMNKIQKWLQIQAKYKRCDPKQA